MTITVRTKDHDSIFIIRPPEDMLVKINFNAERERYTLGLIKGDSFDLMAEYRTLENARAALNIIRAAVKNKETGCTLVGDF